jgi:hypothetical protein
LHPDVRQLGTDGKRRHAVQRIANEFGVTAISLTGLSGFMIVSWLREYVAQAHLGAVDELMIPETWRVDETVRTVLASFPPEEAGAKLARSRS